VPQSLDLDVDDTRKARSSPRAIEPNRARDGAKPQAKGGVSKPAGKKMSARTRLLVLVGGLAVVLLGVGGFFYYQRAQKQKSRANQVKSSLAEARRQLADDGPGHWKRAAQAAQAALAVSPKHGEALELSAIANLAGYLDEGTDKKPRLAAADRAVETMRSAGASGPLADKALGLHGVLKTDRVGALERLTAVAKKNPKDLDAQLFLGWGAAIAHDYPTAIAAFQAAAAGESRTVTATYGLGLAQLASGDLEGARKSFAAVLAKKKDHIGAQIGSTAAMSSSSDYARRETELLSILGRDDIAKADPRAVALGWALAGDDARRGAHLDTARDRYRKALALDEECVPAKVGNAEIAIAEGRLDEAATTLEDVLESAPGDPAASLALADVHLRGNKIPEAAALIDHLASSSLAPADRGRRSMIEGRIHQAQGDLERALTAYAGAQTELGDADITPTIAQVALLGTMAADATKAGNAPLHDELSARAAALLGAFETKARSDVEMALTLGRAYLSVDNGVAAQKWLEVVLSARTDDIETRSLLAKSLGQQGKTVEMLQRLREAFDLDPTRADIGLDLATRYEAAGQNTEAAAMYAKVLASPQATLDTRVHAGLFYARIGDFASAAVQGDAILAAEATNPAGEFLKAEGLYAAEKYADALTLYKSAAGKDERAARYWDGYGRAAEKIGLAQNDSRYKDEALVAYGEAVKLDATMLASQLGRGRLHLERREFAKALEAFEAAREIDPSSADIAYGEGIAYAQLGKKDLAVQWLQKSVKERPSADAYHTLARLYLDANQSGPAAGAYANATRLAQQDERNGKPQITWLTDDYWQLGELEKDAGHDRQACAAYNAYLGRNPSDQVKVNNVKTVKLGLRCN
jgi:tetratricopeptide (TPR) repeat protein